MKAVLKNYRQSPRKVRLLADLVRGKSVKRAIDILSFTDKRASDQVIKVIRSAEANAKTNNETAKKREMIVKNIVVNKGVTQKRYMPRARGAGSRINKRSSHITVELT